MVKKYGFRWRQEKRRQSGSMKRGAVGAVADFLGVVGVGGQIRAKCLCYNKRIMFHVTLFELFRAARGCYDFARSFIVALEKAVGRFKNMVAIALEGGIIRSFCKGAR